MGIVRKWDLSPDGILSKLKDYGSSDSILSYEKILSFSDLVRKAGGCAFLVGGSVRDLLLKRIPKDFDIEVFGLELAEISLLAEHIGSVCEVGKSFGILKVSIKDGMEIDISIPRRDSKNGNRHSDFNISSDAFMSKEDALRRRDFTMNAIMVNPLNGEIFDPFGGMDDIEQKVLRITDRQTFGEDPLRVMRAVQFISRYGLTLDCESESVIRSVIPHTSFLSKERIFEEWKKLLLKSEKPSLGLSVGMKLGIFHTLHPEFPPLVTTEQNVRWHPEGDVWTHTLMALDEAVTLVNNEQCNEEERLTILLAVLCHDLGKPKTTEHHRGQIVSYGHEQAGAVPTQNFLDSLGVSTTMREKVIRLVTNHLSLRLLFDEEMILGHTIKDGSFRRLANRLHPATIRELLVVSEADHLGRGPFDLDKEKDLLIPPREFPVREWIQKRALRLDVFMHKSANLTRGSDWIEKGFLPGKSIGQLIALANSLRDERDFTKDMVFSAIDGIINAQKAIGVLNALLGK